MKKLSLYVLPLIIFLALNVPCFAVENDWDIAINDEGLIILTPRPSEEVISEAPPIDAVGLPDLVISSVTFKYPCPGVMTTVTVTIKNQGDTATSNNFFVDFYYNQPTAVGCYFLGDMYRTVNTFIAPGETTNVEFQATWSAGTFALRIFADTYCSVGESNKENNQFAWNPFVVAAKPDLLVSNIDAPNSAFVGQPIDVTFTIYNRGCTATNEFWIEMWQDKAAAPGCSPNDWTDFTYYGSGLNVNTSASSTKTFTYNDPGTYTIWAFVDAVCNIDEIYETNNFLTKTITILPAQPDLIVKNITTNPPLPDAGDIVTLGITIANIGAGAAPSGFYLDFYKSRETPPPFGQAGDTYLYLPPGMPGSGYEYTTYDMTMSWDTCGTYKMWAQIDTYNTNVEANEYNNVFGSQNITICGNCPNYDKILSLVQEYYRDILDREPEPGGAEGWADEICRIQNLGIYVGEGFQAEARLFFNSAEYIAKGKSNTAFVIDLYQTFLQREPDETGLKYWGEQLKCLTRNMLITQFAYCDEFKTYLTSLFGVDTTRPENNLVNDFYRGILGRLPDDGGFNDWLGQMRTAQCTSAQAVEDVSYAQSLAFVQSGEYTAKGRDNMGYIEDLYNAILRRGADCGGFTAWVDNLNSMTRVQVLQAFTACIEFQTRVDAVIAAGCLY